MGEKIGLNFPNLKTFRIGVLIVIFTIVHSNATVRLVAEQRTMEQNETCSESGYFGNPTDCNQFYRCVEENGELQKFQFECPPGLIFDKNISSCNHESVIEPKPPCLNAIQSNHPSAGQPNYPHKFSIIGSKYGLVYFRYNQSSDENLQDVEKVEMENVLVDPETLINFLSQTTKLKSLILRNVEFTSNIDDTVHLPHLEEFYLSHVRIIKPPSFLPQPNDTKTVNEFKTYKKSFKTLIFFYKDNWNWQLENISSLRTNIDVLIHSVPIFKLNWRENQVEVESVLEFTDDLISNWDPNAPALEKLTLANISLNVPTVPTTLKMIDFEFVKYVNGSFSDILRMNKALKYVRGIMFPQPRYPKIYLSDLPRNIQWLFISRGQIVKSEPNFLPGSGHIEFLHLNHLKLDMCLIDDDVMQDFSGIFRTRSVVIVFPEISNGTFSENYSLLKEILKGSRDRLIIMGMLNFERHPAIRPPVYQEIEDFLNKAGVPEGQRNFILEKKSDGDWHWHVGSNRFGLI